MKRTYCPPERRKANNSMSYVRNVGIKHQKERDKRKEDREFQNRQFRSYIYASGHTNEYNNYEF